MILGGEGRGGRKKRERERERERERDKKKPMILEAMSNSTITYKFSAWHYVDSKNLK